MITCKPVAFWDMASRMLKKGYGIGNIKNSFYNANTNNNNERVNAGKME